MAFYLTVDFGYCCGGPQIRPDTSMQKLVHTTTFVKGGKQVSLLLDKPVVDYHQILEKVWLRPGKELPPEMLESFENIDSYRDIAVFAVKGPREIGIGGSDRCKLLIGKELNLNPPDIIILELIFKPDF